jgi:spore coat protein U-like protein
MIPRGNVVVSYLMGPTLTPVSVAANITAEQNFTVRGLQVGDYVNVTANVAQTAGIGIVNARVSAADTLTVGFSNSTAGGLTPAAGVYLIDLSRADGALPLNAA